MTYPFVVHHGAINGVTGSCHQLQMTDSSSILIDCGLFQCEEAQAQSPDISFSLEGIKALVITHVHADHVGRLPYLLAAGYKGPILCSEPSAKLLPLILEDAFKLEVSREPMTIERYLQRVSQQIIALPFDHWFSIEQKKAYHLQIRLQRAGHILESAYVECDVEYLKTGLARRIVFSGDLGAPHTPFLPAPDSPESADILILESTYGDRLHENRLTRQERLSLGRTQELLYKIEDILYRKNLSESVRLAPADNQLLPISWSQVPVIIDSPLASRLTKVYRELEHYWNAEAKIRLRNGRIPLHFGQLITVDSHAKHLQTVNYLASTGRPAIVIAVGGMCSSGRIANYLKAMLTDKRHNVLFTGYQAKGTPGALIQKYGPSSGFVELKGERCMIRAGVSTLGGYSAHADQKDLLNFVSGMSQWPEEIRLVHGEERARRALAKELLSLYRAQNKRVDVLVPSDVKPLLGSKLQSS